jgi:hypothetical protein
MKRRPLAPSPVEQHRDWLSLLDIEGPFLSIPPLMRVWPNGIGRPESGNPQVLQLMEMHAAWIKSPISNHEKWIKAVLGVGAQWGDSFLRGPDVPSRFKVSVPEHHSDVIPDGVLFHPDANQSTDSPLALVFTVAPNIQLREASSERWTASPIDRISIALRRLKIPIGIVSNGRAWALVWAEGSTSTTSAIFDSVIWGEEKYLRDAFFALIGIQRFVGVQSEDKLPALFAESLLQQEDITEELGKQVRQAVELLVQSFSESRIEALRNNELDPLPDNEHHPYNAAVTVMMRIVFMLFAEELGMLPVSQSLYSSAYAISGILDQLEEQSRLNEEILDASSAVWHRLLSAGEALYFGASFEDMRMPAYGGSLFDPDRYPWLSANDPKGGLRLIVSDRVMLHVLRSIQKVTQAGYSRKISFREVDVEQIGYIYEGLLGFTSRKVSSDTVLGLVGSPGYEPEIALSALQSLHEKSKSPEIFIDKLLEYLEGAQPGSKLPGKAKLVAALGWKTNDAVIRSKLGAVTSHDDDLIEQITPFYYLLRLDLRELPYVVPINGIVVTETQSRKNSGAHYTPRALAEEVVEHALKPLVYNPGPFATADTALWKIKNSAEILDLRVVDIAVGSGAFLVAAARFLAARLMDAWENEGITTQISDQKERRNLSNSALREIISKCLYGADINEMAIEMCKLSLWLTSLDPTKPFTFLNDKVFLGNSLLGLVSRDQLTQLHIFPEATSNLVPKIYQYDVETPLNKVVQIRKEISASPVEEFDSHRTANHKNAMLLEAHEITRDLSLLANAVIAVGLNNNGKPGARLDSAYAALAFNAEQAFGFSDIKANENLNNLVQQGLTPTVPTDYERWQPLHWVLEAPDVFEKGGFDSVIGNPPFLVSKKISGAMGGNLREWLANVVAEKSGRSDLVAYFFRRAFDLLNEQGTLGLIGAQAISEGDTLLVGIEPLTLKGGTTYKLERNRKWPTRAAATNISIVWLTRRAVQSKRMIDGQLVNSISSILSDDDLELTKPKKLVRSIPCSVGNIFLGEGFKLDADTADSFLKAAKSNAEVIFPVINGKILNSQINGKSDQFIIDFRRRNREAAQKYELPWARVLELVKPLREKLDPIRYSRRRDFWWIHATDYPELYRELDKISNALALSIVSTYMVPVRISARNVFSSAVLVWPIEDYAFFAILSSWPHRAWGEYWASRMRDTFRYTMSDCFDTFPFPRTRGKLASLGRELDDWQKHIAKSNGMGITKIYGRFNDPTCRSAEILKLRELHVAIDREVLNCYGFLQELGEYEFLEFSKIVQYAPSFEISIKIIQFLLAENQKQESEGVVEWPI